MIVLGIQDGFDAGCAVIEDGRLLSAVNEERLSRIKFHAGHTNGWPRRSVEAALELAGVAPRDVDAVAVAGIVDTPVVARVRGARVRGARVKGPRAYGGGAPAMGVDSHFLKKKAFNFFANQECCSVVGRISRSVMRPRFESFIAGLGMEHKALHFVDHHHAHAAGAYYTGNKRRALAVTMDGHGDGLSGTVAVFDGGQMKRIAKTPSRGSVGWFYSQITHALGFKMHRHEGKVTGLAAFGKRGGPAYTALGGAIRVDESGLGTINRQGYKYDGLKRLQAVVDRFPREEVAAAAQQHLEEVVCAVIAAAVEETGVTDVVAGGGTFGNVRLNQKISELPGVTSFFVHPHMGDGGLACGAALATWAKLAPDPGPVPLETVCLGSSFDDADIERELADSSLVFRWHQDVEGEVARMLAAGKVVARFDGRMEYGPRALGNRSILAPATDGDINDRLNGRLNRTDFMPFAPVLTHEAGSLYFAGYLENEYACRFMTMTLDTKPAARKYRAVVHVDGTARPQGVRRSSNPRLYRILEEYHRRTGLEMLVNTSFNMHEEPIVSTPSDAIRAFQAGCADALAIGPFVSERPSHQGSPVPGEWPER